MNVVVGDDDNDGCD